MSPEMAAAITAEVLNASIRFYFLYKRMQVLQGMTEEEADKKYLEVKAEFEKRPPDELLKLIEG